MSVFLVVDDEPAVQNFLQKTVKRMRHEVRVAGSYQEAVSLVERGSWDIALLDIILWPDGGTGIDLLRVAHNVAPDHPVLMATAFPGLDSAQEALRLGAFDYVVKPIHADELVKILERALVLREVLLERQRLERESFEAHQRLEAVFNSVLDGIITVDHAGRVSDLNDAAVSLLNVSQNEATGTSLMEICAGGRESIAVVVENSLKTGEFVREYRVTGQSGERGWAYTICVAPLKGGNERSAVVVIRDISRLYALEREISERFSFENMIGKSPPMLRIFDVIRHLADTDTTVLIQGPSGTGKELVGAALHYHGVRKNGPLVKVNCGALPESLLESELFGHVRGAFTGATGDKIGRFERAHGGTIFLDEIGDMSPYLQQRLLRVLQEHEIERVGSSNSIKIDVRVVAATNRDASELVSRGLLREDLYYRLNVVTIDIPPLRERREDIPFLIRHFLQRFEDHLGRVIQGIDSGAMQLLLRYDWPGNVRQLENFIEHAVVLNEGGLIRLENLPPELLCPVESVVPQKSATRVNVDSQRLREVLDSVGWIRSRAAKRLGVHRNTISRWIKEYGVAAPPD
ncbi:MAG: sigma 54-interacting transcriptional regulator [bacterium]